MWQRFLFWLTGFLPCRIINGDHGEPYLERYFLFGAMGRAVFIHRFVGSDPDRGTHCHPWDSSFSIILSGRYLEIRLKGARVLTAPALNLIRGTDFHRIVLMDQDPVWTLFVHGKRTKGWGFLHNGVYTPFAIDATDHQSVHWWRTAPRRRTA